MLYPESVVRHLDYRDKADERRAELEALNRKTLAKLRGESLSFLGVSVSEIAVVLTFSHHLTRHVASRLQTADMPKEMTNFREEQREMFREQKRRKAEALELLHKYRADKDSVNTQREVYEEAKKQKTEALEVLHRYRAAKEAVLKRTRWLWHDHPESQEKQEKLSRLLQSVDAYAHVWKWDAEESKTEDDLPPNVGIPMALTPRNMPDVEIVPDSKATQPIQPLFGDKETETLLLLCRIGSPWTVLSICKFRIQLIERTRLHLLIGF
jgi:hypothetical protein